MTTCTRWALLAGLLFATACAGVPFGAHVELADAGLEQALRAQLPETATAAQARLRGTLHLGSEALELTLLVRADGPGQGRVAAIDDLGLRVFDVELDAGRAALLSSAPGLPAAPLLALGVDLVAAFSWAPAAGWTAVRTSDGRRALADALGRPGLRLSRRPPADLAAASDGEGNDEHADALWLETGADGERRACLRLEAWTPGPEGRFVYPARVRVAVPGDLERLTARLESWRPLTVRPATQAATEP